MTTISRLLIIETLNNFSFTHLYLFGVWCLVFGVKMNEDKGSIPRIPVSNVTTFTTMIKPKTFSANPNESVLEWLDVFDIASTANNWDADQKRLRVGAFLDGTAHKWYVVYQKSNSKSDWEKFKKDIIKVFDYANPKVAKLDALQSRKMSYGEKFENYFYDKLRLCNEYNDAMDEKEKIGHIIRGLTPSLIDRAYIHDY